MVFCDSGVTLLPVSVDVKLLKMEMRSCQYCTTEFILLLTKEQCF